MFSNLIVISAFINVLHATSKYTGPGYIAYCPCMGRFGNQADQFLGALAFAKGINRTLILPPWVEYRYGEPRSIQVPFDTYFQVEHIQRYHTAITMERFMHEHANTIWPRDQRISHCYMPRGDGNDCNAKEGNPFGPFWDTFNVTFVGSRFYQPLHYDMYHDREMPRKWNDTYPPSEWPVLAFTGAPGSFPVQAENRALQKYVKWSVAIDQAADRFVKEHLPRASFIGIHLRNGIDWVRACQHVAQSPNLFAAPQCLGYKNEKGKATVDMCHPARDQIVRQLKRLLKKMNANQTVRGIYVASDNNHMVDELKYALARFNLTVVRLREHTLSAPHMDLAILARANHFVGNCISSFSAFVKRERDVRGLPTTFWAFPTEKSQRVARDEL